MTKLDKFVVGFNKAFNEVSLNYYAIGETVGVILIAAILLFLGILVIYIIHYIFEKLSK